MKRRANGEGTIYKRQGGRLAAQVYVTLPDGSRKRQRILGRKGESYSSVHNRLAKIKEQERKKIPFGKKRWTVGEWLDHWLLDILPTKKTRRKTIIGYERDVELYIKPNLGNKRLEELSVSDVQSMLDKLNEEGRGIRTLHKIRATLSSALGRAMKEELIFRNVAATRLIDLPKYKSAPKVLWTSEQQTQFIEAAKKHPWYIGFLGALTYGLREGEILGLRWVDFDIKNNTFIVRQQIQRYDQQYHALPLKTDSSCQQRVSYLSRARCFG